MPDATAGLTEDQVKAILEGWLHSAGWTARVAWEKMRGIDIEAQRRDERWVIETKGCGSLPAMRVNYFLAVLGEILQRMDDDQARYSLAFPDLPQFRGLWERLPKLAKARLCVTALFVRADGTVVEAQ
jgi:hypothetical protein